MTDLQGGEFPSEVQDTVNDGTELGLVYVFKLTSAKHVILQSSDTNTHYESTMRSITKSHNVELECWFIDYDYIS